MGYLWIAVGLALGGLLRRTGLTNFAGAREDRMTTERRRRVRSVQRPARTRTRRHAAKRAAA
jgi:hypothetical protein